MSVDSGRIRVVASLAMLVLAVPACSPSDGRDTTVADLPTVTPGPQTSQAGAVSTTSVAEATTTTSATKQIDLAWECEELEQAFGDVSFSCSTRLEDRTIIEFVDAYLNGSVVYELNDQNERVGVVLSASAYNGNCMWRPVDGGRFAGPLEAGEAVLEGVLVGTDRCEGHQYSFRATWHESTLAIDMEGVIEPVG